MAKQMHIPRTGDRIGGSDYPFGDTIASLHDAVRANVEATLSEEYRVIEVEARFRTEYTRPYESEGEIDPARVLPYLLVPDTGKMTFEVRAGKIARTLLNPDVIELTLRFDADGLIVTNVSLSRVY